MTAKQRVMRFYPTARHEYLGEGSSGHHIEIGRSAFVDPIGTGRTEEAAWADAALRLPSPVSATTKPKA